MREPAVGEPAVREPAVAGLFYPEDPRVLRETVSRLVDAVDVPAGDRLAAAYVVPHAGYRYSGPTAAHVYARLRKHAAQIQRVVIIGPAHRVPLVGAAVPVTGTWRTPLGEVPIDVAGAARLVEQGLAVATDEPHTPEHSLEVQLPFLQLPFLRPPFPGPAAVAQAEQGAAAVAQAEQGAAAVAQAEHGTTALPPVLPICVGRTPADSAAALVAALVGPGVVVLCSTDLSHYLTEAEARERDARTVRSVVELTPERLESHDACGFFALRGLLTWAGAAQCAVAVHHQCTSADTAGTPDRVVGYCAASVHCHAA